MREREVGRNGGGRDQGGRRKGSWPELGEPLVGDGKEVVALVGVQGRGKREEKRGL